MSARPLGGALFAVALCMLPACSTRLELPAPSMPADDEASLSAAFVSADAQAEAKMREAVAPGSSARLRRERLAGSSDATVWLEEGQRLFTTDTPWDGTTTPPLVRPLAAAGRSADATRCVGCHHAGGLGGGGSFGDRVFTDSDGDDVLEARATLPPMLAGAAVLELVSGGTRSLRANVQRAVAMQLGEHASDAELDALVIAIAAIPLPIQETFEADSLRLRAAQGRVFFDAWGCSGCHVATARLTGFTLALTGRRTLDLEASLRAQWHVPSGPVDAPVFSDFKPHDLGTGAGVPTTPLWGVASRLAFLHDGRVSTIDEAIEAHGGEASASREKWRAAQMERRELSLFLLSLTRPTRLEGSP